MTPWRRNSTTHSPSFRRLPTVWRPAKEPPASCFKDPSLYNNADQMLIETRQLVKSIREDPKKYLTFKVKVF